MDFVAKPQGAWEKDNISVNWLYGLNKYVAKAILDEKSTNPLQNDTFLVIGPLEDEISLLYCEGVARLKQTGGNRNARILENRSHIKLKSGTIPYLTATNI